MSDQRATALVEPMAGTPGCTPGGSCRTVIALGGLPALPRALSPTLVGCGATADASGLPPVRTSFDLNAEPSGEQDLVWTDAVFVQELPGVGPLWMRLADRAPSRNRLRSLTEDQDTFFPARSETAFLWRLDLPRLGWRYENAEPMVTRTIEPHLLSYPVQWAAYAVDEPVTFERVGRSRVPAPPSLRVTSHFPVQFGPPSTLLDGAVTVLGREGATVRLRIRVGPYRRVRGPRRLRVAWYLRDTGAGGDPDRPVRGVVTVPREGDATFETTWTQTGAAEHERGLTLVLLSLSADTPGHAERAVPLTG